MPSRSPQGERGLKPYVAGIGAGIAGRSPQGERGLKLFEPQTTDPTGSRSPQGERGLKPRAARPDPLGQLSLPARGAWVETSLTSGLTKSCGCRSPQGERGLKPRKSKAAYAPLRRSPQGERGLKLRCRRHVMPPAARRSPQGERGLKLGRLPSRMGHGAVAPRKGSVG